MRRQPSEAELALYRKWTLDWGFSQDGIVAACTETTGAGTPTFRYLDKILEALRERGAGSAESTRKAIDEGKQETEQIRDLFHCLNLNPEYIGEDVRALYRAMCTENGSEILMIAAESVGKVSKSPSLDKVQKLLDSWHDKNLYDAAAIREYLAGIEKENDELRRLAEKCGPVKRTEANRALLRKWVTEWNTPQALIDLAAGFASGAKNPMPYMDKLLTGWREKGIDTVAGAEAEHASHAVSSTGTSSKTVNAQKYEQRTNDLTGAFTQFTPEELEEMMRDDT